MKPIYVRPFIGLITSFITIVGAHLVSTIVQMCGFGPSTQCIPRVETRTGRSKLHGTALKREVNDTGSILDSSIHLTSISPSIHPYLDMFNEDSHIILPIMIMQGMISSNIRLFLLQLKYAVCKTIFTFTLHCRSLDYAFGRMIVLRVNRTWIRVLLHILTSYDHSTPSSKVETFPNSNMTM